MTFSTGTAHDIALCRTQVEAGEDVPPEQVRALLEQYDLYKERYEVLARQVAFKLVPEYWPGGPR